MSLGVIYHGHNSYGVVYPFTKKGNAYVLGLCGNHIGVGSDVVCSTIIGNARASVRGIDNRTIPRFFMPDFEKLFIKV